MFAVSHDKPLGLQKNVHWKLSLFVFPEVPYKMSVSLKGFSLNWTPEVGDLPGWFRSSRSCSVSIKWGFTVHKYTDKSVKIHFCSWKTIGTKVLFIKKPKHCHFLQTKIYSGYVKWLFLANCLRWFPLPPTSPPSPPTPPSTTSSWRCLDGERNWILGQLTSDKHKEMKGKCV